MPMNQNNVPLVLSANAGIAASGAVSTAPTLRKLRRFMQVSFRQ